LGLSERAFQGTQGVKLADTAAGLVEMKSGGMQIRLERSMSHCQQELT